MRGVAKVLKIFNGKFCMSVMATAFLVSCSGNDKPQPQAQSTPQSTLIKPDTNSANSNRSQSSKQVVIDRLLQDAEIALSRDQLMTPVHRNALDKFRAVLLFDEKNTEALLGVGKVVTRYCELAQLSASNGQFNQAKIFLMRAESVGVDLSIVTKTQEFIAQTQRNFTQLVTLENPVENKSSNEISLSKRQLKRRAKSLAQELQSIALQVRETDQYVLIVAPTDSDGRWVYQEMKKAVPGYRLRGDIRRGQSPKIVLDAPLE